MVFERSCRHSHCVTYLIKTFQILHVPVRLIRVYSHLASNYNLAAMNNTKESSFVNSGRLKTNGSRFSFAKLISRLICGA